MRAIRRNCILLLCGLVACILAACSGLSTEQKETLVFELTRMLNEGIISQAQFDALLAAVNNQGDFWDRVLEIGGQVLATALFVFTGVRVTYGPASAARRNAAKALVSNASSTK